MDSDVSMYCKQILQLAIRWNDINKAIHDAPQRQAAPSSQIL